MERLLSDHPMSKYTPLGYTNAMKVLKRAPRTEEDMREAARIAAQEIREMMKAYPLTNNNA